MFLFLLDVMDFFLKSTYYNLVSFSKNIAVISTKLLYTLKKFLITTRKNLLFQIKDLVRKSMYLVCRGMWVPLLYDGNIESGNSTVVVGPRTLSYGSSFWYRLFIFRRYRLFYHYAPKIRIQILPASYSFLSMTIKKDVWK